MTIQMENLDEYIPMLVNLAKMNTAIVKADITIVRRTLLNKMADTFLRRIP